MTGGDRECVGWGLHVDVMFGAHRAPEAAPSSPSPKKAPATRLELSSSPSSAVLRSSPDSILAQVFGRSGCTPQHPSNSTLLPAEMTAAPAGTLLLPIPSPALSTKGPASSSMSPLTKPRAGPVLHVLTAHQLVMGDAQHESWAGAIRKRVEPWRRRGKVARKSPLSTVW